ncbi:MAG: J domain-containing protein [Polyangiaceae bacterium]|nr:J domain-containing protein [Polyangiaceae bacterium]
MFRANALGDAALASLVRAARTAVPLHPSEFLHGRPRARAGAPREHETRVRDLEILGLSTRASREEIRQAFRRLAHRHHPDRATDERDRTERNTILARLAAAYSRLTQRA